MSTIVKAYRIIEVPIVAPVATLAEAAAARVLADMRIAPDFVMATTTEAFVDRSGDWHIVTV